MLIIKEQEMNNFLEKLKEEFEFFPARGESASGGDSFKKYFLPPVEEIFPVARPQKKFVLFGLSLPDLEALTQLDEIMKKPNEDFFYFQRRKQAIVIGLTEERIDAAPGGDIMFQNLGGGRYKVWENTTKGKNLIKKYALEMTSDVEEQSGKTSPRPPRFAGDAGGDVGSEWQKSMRELLLDSELLANAVEWSRENHKIWDELAETCIGCGICTYVCPLCYCFSIEDRVGLDDKCSRCRKWAACTLPEFSKIAGGHSFRPTLKERYYNWFYHKFVRAYNEYGKSQCVGCERCKKSCPAGIDIKEVLEIILEDYKKQNG